MSLRIPPPKPPIDWEVARDLRQEGLTNVEIARQLGYTPRAVSETLAAQGVPPRRRTLRTARQWGVQLYGHWKSIRSRCTNKNDHLYPRHGGRGIRVCRTWSDFEQFHAWALASGYRPGANILLRPGAKSFSPSTCSWVSAKERIRLQATQLGRKPGLLIAAFGEKKPAAQWAQDKRCKVSAPALLHRLRLGWLPIEAITLPPGSTPTQRRKAPPKVLYRSLDWGRIVRLHKEGLTPGEIADRLGNHSYTIRQGLLRRGQLASPPHRGYRTESTFTTCGGS